MKELVIHIDGASRGNPGPSGIGIVVKDISGEVVENIKKYIGIATNNTAEYSAFLTALGAAEKLGANKIKIFLDPCIAFKWSKKQTIDKECLLATGSIFLSGELKKFN